MKVLHVTPGHSAAASLRHALRDAGSADELVPCPEDFSFGPISSPAARAAWWETLFDEPDAPGFLRLFWQRLEAWDGRLVLWFGRSSAWDLSFLHLMADTLPDRPLFAVDVTGLQYPSTRQDGTRTLCEPTSTVSSVVPGPLQDLLGTERELGQKERAALRSHWQVLLREDALFRVVGEAGLVSAPEDHFDQALLDFASTTWRKLAHVVGDTLASERARFQVGDLMLHVRAVALMEQGRLLAEGDPWDMRACKVRLPDALPTG
ncbi:MAG: DUF3658 domain-containing protein [Nevskia sp.]|nr:DUF3658 domain-containing protein [Nevskia sp.]